jgi:hypothetical protein
MFRGQLELLDVFADVSTSEGSDEEDDEQEDLIVSALYC